VNQELHVKDIQGLNKKMNKVNHQVHGSLKGRINTRTNQLFRY